jgi:NADH-quinone oxidoreductase subunit C
LSTHALDKVAAKHPDAVAERYADRAGGNWMVVKPEAIREVASFLKNDPELDFKLFLSIDAVDRLLLPNNTPRFEVVYFLRSLTLGEVVQLKCRVPEDKPELPSISSVYQGANWWERFVWDFYGITFTGHPDLRRILLYEEFRGHPLRKDYPLRERQPLLPERPIKDIFRGPGTSGVA